MATFEPSPDLDPKIAQAIQDAMDALRAELLGRLDPQAKPVPLGDSGGDRLSRLEQAVGAIDSATSQTELLTRFLEEAGAFADRSLFLVRDGDDLNGWAAFGFSAGAEDVAQVSVSCPEGVAAGQPQEDATVADAVVRLETDDAIGLLEDLDDDVRAQVLDAVPAVERAHFESGLGYPEDSAGRLMQRDFIGIPEFWTVGQAIDFMRDSEDLPEDFYELFVVDPAQRPVGTLPLNRFIRTPRDGVIGSIMDRNPHLIPVDMDQEDAAFEFQQYDLMSAGVVGTSGRLLGVIMIDDIVDVINEEVEEDLLRLGGVAETDLARSVLTTTRRRFSWLFVNLLTAIFASFVIFMFEATIEEIVAVAMLAPNP